MATVLCVAAHFDDEVLMTGGGLMLVEHVLAGHDVHVVVMSHTVGGVGDQINGNTQSPWWGTMHDLVEEGYTALTNADIYAARLAECQRAMLCLAAGIGTITVHDIGLASGFTPAIGAGEILEVANSITTGPVRLKVHSWVDNHADHVAVSDAATLLKVDDPTRFGDVRRYVEPPYWADARLTTVAGKSWDLPTNADVSARAKNALHAYGAWCPPHSYAIGWHSVYASHFAPLLSAAGLKALYHP